MTHAVHVSVVKGLVCGRPLAQRLHELHHFGDVGAVAAQQPGLFSELRRRGVVFFLGDCKRGVLSRQFVALSLHDGGQISGSRRQAAPPSSAVGVVTLPALA